MPDKTVEFIMADHSRLVAENKKLQQDLAEVTKERDKLRAAINRIETIADLSLGIINVMEKHQRRR